MYLEGSLGRGKKSEDAMHEENYTSTAAWLERDSSPRKSQSSGGRKTLFVTEILLGSLRAQVFENHRSEAL